jgi:ABC-type sugar transport system substrate-binding protein
MVLDLLMFPLQALQLLVFQIGWRFGVAVYWILYFVPFFAACIYSGVQHWRLSLAQSSGAKIERFKLYRSATRITFFLFVLYLLIPTAWVGSDFTEEGRNAARWLEEDLKGKKFDQKETVHIVVLRGTSNASATLGRTKGFAEIAKTHPNWEILDSDDADFTTAKGREVMEKYLQKYKDIDVVVSQNDDMTFGAIEAIRAAGKTTGTGGDITLISFDGTRSALEKVKSGVINVDIECNPLQGTYIQEIINRLGDGEPVDKINYVEEKVYTQKNVLSVLGDRVY